MNAEKAREYFSQYYEKELEGGLLESFERALKSDAQIQAEYRAFEYTMEQLSALAVPVPEPDFDLHEAISRRLDRHQFETSRSAQPSFWQHWGRVLVGGVAGIAILGTVASFLMKSNNASTSGPVPIVKPAVNMIDTTRFDLLSENDQWSLIYTAKGVEKIRILDSNGLELESARLDGKQLVSPLHNQGVEASLIEFRVEGAKYPVFIAMPPALAEGSEGKTIEGNGNIQGLAQQAAKQCGRPVVFVQKTGDVDVKWSLEVGKGVESISQAVASHGYAAEEAESGAIWIR